MEKDLYLCNECDNLHADETHYCEACGCDSIRIVPESELQGEKMEWKEEGE